MNKIKIELIPESAWGKNVRSVLSPDQWKMIKKFIFAKANYKCEICGGQGAKWPVECHEVFRYNKSKKTQTLTRLEARCPLCHLSSHLGVAEREGMLWFAKQNLMKLNNWTPDRLEEEIVLAIRQNQKRSQIEWKLDLTYLNQFGFKLEKP